MTIARDTPSLVEDDRGDEGFSDVSAVFSHIVHATVAAGLASAAIIVWETSVNAGAAHAPAVCESSAASVIAFAQRRIGQQNRSQRISIRPDVLKSLLKNSSSDRPTVGVASHVAGPDGFAMVVLLSHGGGGEPSVHIATIETSVRLVLIADAARRSRDFWRSTATQSGERAALLQAERNAIDTERALIESRRSAITKLKPDERLAGLGQILGEAGNFNAWIVAQRIDSDSLEIAASSASADVSLPDDLGAAMTDSLRQDTVVLHTSTDPAGLEASPLTFLCIPFGRLVTALTSSAPILSTTRSRMEELRKALLPVVASWDAEDEIHRLQNLIQILSRRIYRAVEEERRRIARDLHDDLAQLLTAARIAIETDAGAARGILKQLDTALRSRVRALRPVTLGPTLLSDAINNEIERLTLAGIAARVVRPRRTIRLSRSTQDLCYQIVREAVSNILRHAHASEVEIQLTKADGRVRLRVNDNGRGPRLSRRKGSGGTGLIGLIERVELMGGTLSLDRIDAITRLSVEIPDI